MPESEEAKEFTVAFVAPACITVRIKAKDVDEALEKAEEELYDKDRGLCHDCSSPGAVSFRETGNITRYWPEDMSPMEVNDESGRTVWNDHTVI